MASLIGLDLTRQWEEKKAVEKGLHIAALEAALTDISFCDWLKPGVMSHHRDKYVISTSNLYLQYYHGLVKNAVTPVHYQLS